MENLIRLATMKRVSIPQVPMGQRIRYIGDMANPSGVGAVVEITGHEYGPYTVALEDGREMRCCILQEPRYEILHGQIADQAMLTILRAGVNAAKAAQKARDTSAAQSFGDAVERIKRENPHLIQGGGHVIAAKNIRTELKMEFPGVKFSVRGRSFAGGDSIDIRWTDGPTTKQVRAISSKYQMGSFDGMTDCYEYRKSAWTEVFGSSKYIMDQRDHSDKAIESAIRRACNRLGGMDAIPTVEDYRMGRLYEFKQSGGCDVRREVHQEIEKQTWCVGASQLGKGAA